MQKTRWIICGLQIVWKSAYSFLKVEMWIMWWIKWDVNLWYGGWNVEKTSNCVCGWCDESNVEMWRCGNPILRCHYENTPMQICRKFHLQKTEKIQIKTSDIFHISAQNIDCGYSLEPPRRGGSNEYPQSMFWAEIWKIMYTPVNPRFTIQKWGLRGSKLYRYVLVMVASNVEM